MTRTTFWKRRTRGPSSEELKGPGEKICSGAARLLRRRPGEPARGGGGAGQSGTVRWGAEANRQVGGSGQVAAIASLQPRLSQVA